MPRLIYIYSMIIKAKKEVADDKYSELSLFRSPMGLPQVAGISRWPHSGYLEIPAAIFETMSRASSPACKVIVTG